MEFTLINRYTCPINGKVTIQAHKVADGVVTRSHGKMSADDIGLFDKVGLVIICDVIRSHNLKDFNIINNNK